MWAVSKPAKQERSMQSLRVVLFVTSLVVAANITYATDYMGYIYPKPIKVSYHDLQPEVRKQVDCLTDNIYFEAGHEPTEGKRAVALVTLNRVKSDNYPKTICEVVKQTKASVCQFSWWCDAKVRAKAIRRQYDKDVYKLAQHVALDVYLNYKQIHDITNGALFYHAEYVPRSAIGVRNLQMTVKIGQHIFYRT
jgi:spore germination cell wall hydrolase CwlJ-like protein